jgi:hypothetical protein
MRFVATGGRGENRKENALVVQNSPRTKDDDDD